jgi:heat shock protein HslJ
MGFNYDVILAFAALLTLAGSEWGPAGGSEQSLQFRNGRVVGHSGCNHYTGSYEQDGNKLTLGPIAATKMACPPDRMEKEQAWFDMLGRVGSFEATHLVLTLKGANGEVIATLQRRDWD